MECEKIIVRNKIYRKGDLVSKLILLTVDYNFSSDSDFKKHYGMDTIMKELFDEEVEKSDFESTQIYQKYLEVKKTGEDNEFFQVMYKIKDDLGIKISEHIYLHHIATGLAIKENRIVPWECVDSKLYIADTWWESDDNIIDDMRNLSIIEFLSKYKGY
ncbi:Hypothetical protein LUCI_0834 [Lucifera butyrica]|uniref:Uncharacterized protein n=1 Tax=Lucifera butyrica TaxID=1351585 RepID=A0A498R2C9_9FIRM|nr:hypothetical protein [Lucifera butyrica]VBB05624.1 Hypothetical protein LUCI_0834 [Lucifera butyrica]